MVRFIFFFVFSCQADKLRFIEIVCVMFDAPFFSVRYDLLFTTPSWLILRRQQRAMVFLIISFLILIQLSTGFSPAGPPTKMMYTVLLMNEGNVDSYDANVEGGCIKNLVNHIRLLDQSLAKSRGRGMFQWIQKQQDDDDQLVLTAQQLDANKRFGILSHGTQSDPIFNYGNIASLELFEQTIQSLCQTPSRYSTVSELMEDRSNLLEEIQSKGYGYIENAIRVSAKGNVFLINRILVWTVFDDNNARIGLAAIYDRDGVSNYDDGYR